MKYIDADKLRAEIERLKHQAEGAKMEWVNEGYNQNAFAEDCRITSFNKLIAFLDTLEEPVSEDLEKAADDHIRKVADAAGHPGWDWETRDIAEAFKAGAEWQKEQMMEEAYEEEVQELYQDDDGIHCCVSVGTDYKPGAIVYVITIPKEEEQ